MAKKQLHTAKIIKNATIIKKEAMNLSSTDLLNYHRCPRLLFLNRFGDKTIQLPPSEFLKRLWKLGRDYESKVIDFFDYKRPKYKVGNYDQGLKETVKLMEEGAKVIYQGVLKIDNLVGIPDLLMKAEGHSIFGDYFYYPVDIKGASTARDKYLYQLASYSYILGEMQNFTPLYGGIMLFELDLQIKYLHSYMKQVVEMIESSTNILSNPSKMPDLFIDSACPMCQWYNLCLPEANEKKDLSLVPGINRRLKAELEKIPIKNYKELAECTKEDIKHIEGLNDEKSQNLIVQAHCLDKRKIFIKSVPALPNTEGKEIFMDFESDFIFDDATTDLIRIDYLIGLLESKDNKETYSHILLGEDENKFVKDLISFIQIHQDDTFYHYGRYEQTILEEKIGGTLKIKLFNLEKALRESVIMPVTSYSLKNIAKALGFKWKNKEASATQSMCWYSNYLETNDKKFLDLSIQYNQDDCIALCIIKKWLQSLRDKNLPQGEYINIDEIL